MSSNAIYNGFPVTAFALYLLFKLNEIFNTGARKPMIIFLLKREIKNYT